MGACSSALIEDDGYAVKINVSQSKGPVQKVFVGTYDSVWKSIQLALIKYPIRVNDMDAGVIETDLIKGDSVWLAPHESKRVSAGRQYKISISVIKGNIGEGKQAFKVTIAKKSELQTNFFSDSQPVLSDGLEESALMYRISREIHINNLLKHASKGAG